VQDLAPELQAEERIGLLDVGALAAHVGKHAERAQLVVDEGADVVGGDGLAVLVADAAGDVVVRRVAVTLVGDEVQELAELDLLAARYCGSR
jgi:hypothetical protein